MIFLIVYLRIGAALTLAPRRIRSRGTMCRLRATRDDLATLCLPNLLGFEPFVASQLVGFACQGATIKTKHGVEPCFIFILAHPEGFEPSVF